MSAPHQVLVVDDDAGVREFLVTALTSAGYEVLSAPDGAAALDLLTASRPTVILLDLLMPTVDGWEFARRYEERPGPRAPIIVLTATRDARARGAGIKAEAWLAKPFDIDDLFACVEQLAREA